MDWADHFLTGLHRVWRRKVADQSQDWYQQSEGLDADPGLQHGDKVRLHEKWHDKYPDLAGLEGKVNKPEKPWSRHQSGFEKGDWVRHKETNLEGFVHGYDYPSDLSQQRVKLHSGHLIHPSELELVDRPTRVDWWLPTDGRVQCIRQTSHFDWQLQRTEGGGIPDFPPKEAAINPGYYQMESDTNSPEKSEHKWPMEILDHGPVKDLKVGDRIVYDHSQSEHLYGRTGEDCLWCRKGLVTGTVSKVMPDNPTAKYRVDWDNPNHGANGHSLFRDETPGMKRIAAINPEYWAMESDPEGKYEYKLDAHNNEQLPGLHEPSEGVDVVGGYEYHLGGDEWAPARINHVEESKTWTMDGGNEPKYNITFRDPYTKATLQSGYVPHSQLRKASAQTDDEAYMRAEFGWGLGQEEYERRGLHRRAAQDTPDYMMDEFGTDDIRPGLTPEHVLDDYSHNGEHVVEGYMHHLPLWRVHMNEHDDSGTLTRAKDEIDAVDSVAWHHHQAGHKGFFNDDLDDEDVHHTEWGGRISNNFGVTKVEGPRPEDTDWHKNAAQTDDREYMKAEFGGMLDQLLDTDLGRHTRPQDVHDDILKHFAQEYVNGRASDHEIKLYRDEAIRRGLYKDSAQTDDPSYLSAEFPQGDEYDNSHSVGEEVIDHQTGRRALIHSVSELDDDDVRDWYDQHRNYNDYDDYDGPLPDIPEPPTHKYELHFPVEKDGIGGYISGPAFAHEFTPTWKRRKRANILDKIQDTLSPTVFNDPGASQPELKPEHIEWLKTQLDYVLAHNDLPPLSEGWIKLVLTGSLTTYQWSDGSDFDVSLFVDWSRSSIPRRELISIMVHEMDGSVVPGTPHEVQCYVVAKENTPATLYKPGLRSAYDLDSRSWIVPPERERSKDVYKTRPEMIAYARDIEAKVRSLLDAGDTRALTLLWHDLHDHRATDQRHGFGDYTRSNVVYKWLANSGLFPFIEKATGVHIASQVPPYGPDQPHPADLYSGQTSEDGLPLTEGTAVEHKDGRTGTVTGFHGDGMATFVDFGEGDEIVRSGDLKRTASPIGPGEDGRRRQWNHRKRDPEKGRPEFLRQGPSHGEYFDYEADAARVDLRGVHPDYLQTEDDPAYKWENPGGEDLCPKCSLPFDERSKKYPAISRVDNKTKICEDCGTQEAIEQFRGGGTPPDGSDWDPRFPRQASPINPDYYHQESHPDFGWPQPDLAVGDSIVFDSRVSHNRNMGDSCNCMWCEQGPVTGKVHEVRRVDIGAEKPLKKYVVHWDDPTLPPEAHFADGFELRGVHKQAAQDDAEYQREEGFFEPKFQSGDRVTYYPERAKVYDEQPTQHTIVGIFPSYTRSETGNHSHYYTLEPALLHGAVPEHHLEPSGKEAAQDDAAYRAAEGHEEWGLPDAQCQNCGNPLWKMEDVGPTGETVWHHGSGEDWGNSYFIQDACPDGSGHAGLPKTAAINPEYWAMESDPNHKTDGFGLGLIRPGMKVQMHAPNGEAQGHGYTFNSGQEKPGHVSVRWVGDHADHSGMTPFSVMPVQRVKEISGPHAVTEHGQPEEELEKFHRGEPSEIGLHKSYQGVGDAHSNCPHCDADLHDTPYSVMQELHDEGILPDIYADEPPHLKGDFLASCRECGGDISFKKGQRIT